MLLDTTTTPELEAEGLARDIVRLVNQARKDSGLHVSDRVRVTLVVPDDVAVAVGTHADYVAAETLALEVMVVDRLSTGHRLELPDGRHVHVGVAKD